MVFDPRKALFIAEDAIREFAGGDLDLARLGLTGVPYEIYALREVGGLDLSANLLSVLPSPISRLLDLTWLDVSDNRLSDIPESIGDLGKLQYLDLSGNDLWRLPTSLRKLSTLRELRLAGNPRLGLPPEITALSRPVDILDYYFRSRDARPLNEAKLILVGRGGVGKTSIARRLLSGEFSVGQTKTEGIAINQWPITLKSGENVRLHVWDFGGQEIMHATHQFFLSQRSIYLLVLAGREGGEDADVEYWLKLIESFGAESSVIVVLNKIREHRFTLNRRLLVEKYAAVRAFVETDCSDGTGITDLLQAIHAETDRLPHLRDAFPISWIAIKDRLSSMRENFLSFEEYRQLCSSLGETEGPEQDRLAAYLHVLGIALNYRDDPRLEDTHVLNPQWVTGAIYRILNSVGLAATRGIMHRSDLRSILPRAEYPAEKDEFVLSLMRKFELCFSYPEDDGRFLVPELLDKQQPEVPTIDPKSSLRFEYHYKILPEGVLPRFIVRSHGLSENLPRWRTGVVMEFEGCLAIVRADIQDRIVSILVGTQPGKGAHGTTKRELLAVIRSDFERIHAEISRLDVSEWVPLRDPPSLKLDYKRLLVLERRGKGVTTEVLGDKTYDIAVSDVLNGVDIVDRPSRSADGQRRSAQPMSVFCCYSHKDERHRARLDVHLKLLQRQGMLDLWFDGRISPGESADRAIDEKLNEADIVVMLLSPDFFDSSYVWKVEMARALERHADGQCRIVPVLLRECSWKESPIGALQCVPSKGPLSKWKDRDAFWHLVTTKIAAAVEAVAASRKAPD